MDDIDSLLLEAWNRIGAKVRSKRVEALRRSQRRFKGILTRPMREWCLVLRASDTRINEMRSIIESDGAIERHEPHTVTIGGGLIRTLTKPIRIPWPGVTYPNAARICGREWKTMRGWVRRGMFRIDYYNEYGFPENGKRSKPLPAKTPQVPHRGGRPYVWTPSPIDPNNFTGRRPHIVWGDMWQDLWMRMPLEFEMVVQREPRFTVCRGKHVFRGWEFVCPGRAMGDGTVRECGRRCTYLYGPQTVWTIGKAMEDAAFEHLNGFEMPDDSGLSGQWFPGLADTIAQPGRRRFACKRCWQVRSACMARADGWNEFVSQISGGLLYGREVPRPLHLCPKKRKKRLYTRRKREQAIANVPEVMNGLEAVATQTG